MHDWIHRLEQRVAKAEAYLLAFCLLSMLFLAIYGIGYRNAVIPFVGWLERSPTHSSIDPPLAPETAPTPKAAPKASPGGETKPSKPAAVDSAAQAGAAESDFDSDFGEEPTPTAAKPAPEIDEQESDFDSDFGEEPAPAAAKPAPEIDEQESDFDSDFGEETTAVAADPAPEIDEQESDFGSDFGDAPTGEKAAVLGVDPPPEASATGKAAAAPQPLEAPPTGPPPRTWLVGLLLWFNFEWIDVVLRHLILWVGFLGAALATTQKKHITIDALARGLSGRPAVAVELVISVVSVIVSLLLLRASWLFTLLEAETGGELFTGVPAWMGPVIIPIGFGLISFHFSLRILRAIETLRSDAPEEPGEADDPADFAEPTDDESVEEEGET